MSRALVNSACGCPLCSTCPVAWYIYGSYLKSDSWDQTIGGTFTTAVPSQMNIYYGFDDPNKINGTYTINLPNGIEINVIWSTSSTLGSDYGSVTVTATIPAMSPQNFYYTYTDMDLLPAGFETCTIAGFGVFALTISGDAGFEETIIDVSWND